MNLTSANPNAATTVPNRVPAAVQLARLLLVGIAAVHAVVPVVMAADRGPLRRSVIEAHPSFAASEVTRAVDIAVDSAFVFHGVLLVACLVFAVLLGRGRDWTRRVTTVSQALSVLFAVVSWSSSPMFHAVIPLVAVAQVAVIALLWRPAASRRFFGSRPAAVPVGGRIPANSGDRTPAGR